MDYHWDNFLCSERNSTEQICVYLYDVVEYNVNASHLLCEHNFHMNVFKLIHSVPNHGCEM